jgi:hypothetical protein
MIKIPRTKPRTTPAVPRPKLMRFSQCLRQRIAEEAEVKETAEKAKAPVSPPALARNPDR